MIINGYLFIYSYLFILIALAFIFNRIFKIRTIIIRKGMHILLSFIWVLSFYYFKDSYHIFIVPITFLLINIIAYQKSIFKWLGSGKHKGIVYYPFSYLILSIITYFHPEFYFAFGIGFMCMGLGDGFAPLIAGYLKSREIINNKTITGTLTVLILSFIVALVFANYFDADLNIFKLSIIAVSSAMLELIGKDGLDNLYLPLGVAAISYILGVI